MTRSRAGGHESVLVRPLAAGDIEEAFEWYEKQRRGLGDEFLDSLQGAIDWTVDHPHAHPVMHRGTRRVLVRRFPYALFYQVNAGQIVVIACMHIHRNPRGWQFRL